MGTRPGRRRCAPTATSLPGVDDRDRRRHLARDRDARPRAVARLPAPARAAAADHRRPPAGPRLAVLRRRLHAGPGRASSCTRWTSSTRSTRGSRWPATRARSRTSAATSRPTASSSRERLEAVRDALARRPADRASRSRRDDLRRALQRGDGQLADGAHARLARPPGGARRDRQRRRRSGSSTGRSPHRLPADADRRADRERGRARLLLRVLPARRPTTARRTSTRALRRAARGWTRRSCRSPTAPAARPPSAARRSTSSSRIKADHGLEAMAHFTCVGATVDELRATLDTMRDAGIENVLALRGDPPAGVDATEWVAAEGGLRYSRELIELIRADYDFAVGAACFPEVHLAAESAESDLQVHPREGRRGREVPDHAAVLRQRSLLRLRGPRARRRHRRPDHPGHHADHQRRPDQALHADVRRDDPARPAARARAARRPAGRGRPTSASPTRRCSAPTCWSTARPASTSTRSTARPRRGRSSARCAASRPGGARSPPSGRAAAAAGLGGVELAVGGLEQLHDLGAVRAASSAMPTVMPSGSRRSRARPGARSGRPRRSARRCGGRPPRPRAPRRRTRRRRAGRRRRGGRARARPRSGRGRRRGGRGCR